MDEVPLYRFLMDEVPLYSPSNLAHGARYREQVAAQGSASVVTGTIPSPARGSTLVVKEI